MQLIACNPPPNSGVAKAHRSQKCLLSVLCSVNYQRNCVTSLCLCDPWELPRITLRVCLFCVVTEGCAMGVSRCQLSCSSNTVNSHFCSFADLILILMSVAEKSDQVQFSAETGKSSDWCPFETAQGGCFTFWCLAACLHSQWMFPWESERLWLFWNGGLSLLASLKWLILKITWILNHQVGRWY